MQSRKVSEPGDSTDLIATETSTRMPAAGPHVTRSRIIIFRFLQVSPSQALGSCSRPKVGSNIPLSYANLKTFQRRHHSTSLQWCSDCQLTLETDYSTCPMSMLAKDLDGRTSKINIPSMPSKVSITCPLASRFYPRRSHSGESRGVLDA